MSYLQTMTEMLSGSSKEQERMIYKTVEMVKEMIKEEVPAMIEEYWKTHIEEYTINIITHLNGKKVDFEGLRADIMGIIAEELSKM